MNDWLGEYYQSIAEKLDLSFSEIIRLALCKHIVDVTAIAFPKHKSKLDRKFFEKIVKERDMISSLPAEDFHKFISSLYFEGRKCADTWLKDKKR